MVNNSTINQIMNAETSEKIIELAHNLTALPSLVIALVSFAIVSLSVGLITFDSSHGRKKYFLSWIISLVVIGGISIFIAFSPHSVQWISNLFKEVFS